MKSGLWFEVAVLACPAAFLVVAFPLTQNPAPPGLAGWVPHIFGGLLLLWGLGRWINN